jgi:hypothetical protein
MFSTVRDQFAFKTQFVGQEPYTFADICANILRRLDNLTPDPASLKGFQLRFKLDEEMKKERNGGYNEEPEFLYAYHDGRYQAVQTVFSQGYLYSLGPMYNLNWVWLYDDKDLKRMLTKCQILGMWPVLMIVSASIQSYLSKRRTNLYLV